VTAFEQDQFVELEFVEFYSKNKFEKLAHQVDFIIRVYHDARSPFYHDARSRVYHYARSIERQNRLIL